METQCFVDDAEGDAAGQEASENEEDESTDEDDEDDDIGDGRANASTKRRCLEAAPLVMTDKELHQASAKEIMKKAKVSTEKIPQMFTLAI